MEIISKSENETKNFAKRVAIKIKLGSVLALIGDLGSGKTTFVKGLAAKLGVKQHITSPTFVLMKAYKTDRNFRLIHVDSYRMQSEEDAFSIGLTELIELKRNVIVIEWADKIMEALPENVIKITFISNDETKKIKVEGLGETSN